jgi:hypothetical protein
MTGKPKIDHYDEKGIWMLLNQKFLCSGCGCDLRQVIKPHFAHYLPRIDQNIIKYRRMIDSIINLTLQCPYCNIGHITQYGKEPMTDLEAQRIENYLRANQAVCEWVNNPNSRDFRIEDIMDEINNFK